MTKQDVSSFELGAMWAASLTIRMTGNKAGAAAVLDNISNTHSVAMQSQEKDIFELRLYLDKDLPLGLNAPYKNIRAGSTISTGQLLPYLEDELPAVEAPPGELINFCIAAEWEDGTPVILLDGILEPEVAISYAKKMRLQISAES